MAQVEHVLVNNDGTVHFRDQNLGPLPADLIGDEVAVRATQDKVNIYHNDKLIASYLLD
jgi:N utilization substance protein A